MSETTPKPDESKQPAIAVDLPAKWDKLDTACARHDYVGVKYWKTVDDPALASLGGGVVTIVSGVAFALSTTHVHVAATKEVSGAEVNDVQTIPRKLVLDLAFYGANAVDPEQLKAWAGA